MNDLIQKMRAGDRRALSRLLSLVEMQDERAFEILKEIWPQTGRAASIGITGPAGAGKSTLIDQMILKLREKGKSVGVIAIDPSSPFTGGAVLGDRVRMNRHFEDPHVFIRSIGTRGKTGGVSLATRALMQVLDVFGVDVILVETVGAGQSEVNIVDLVDSTVVVLVPEAGDAIQALKAGILEIADVFVMNKRDRSGAESLAKELQTMVAMGKSPTGYRAPVVLTEAVSGGGVNELLHAIEGHREHRARHPLSAVERRDHLYRELLEILEARATQEFSKKIKEGGAVTKQLEDVRPNLYQVAEEFLSHVWK